MALSATILTSGTNVAGGSSATTASVTPTSGNLIILDVATRTNITADPNIPTVTGNGLTWVQIATIVWDTTSASRKRITSFRAMGTATSGTIVIDEAAQANTDYNWTVTEWSGMDTTGTNGSGAIVQSNTAKDETATAAILTVNFLSAETAGNGTHGSIVDDNITGLSSIGSGFTQLANPVSTNLDFVSMWQAGNGNPSATFNSNAMLGGIALEIKVAGSGGVVTPSSYMTYIPPFFN